MGKKKAVVNTIKVNWIYLISVKFSFIFAWARCGRTGGKMDGRTDKRTNERTDGRMDGWTDGRAEELTFYRVF